MVFRNVVATLVCRHIGVSEVEAAAGDEAFQQPQHPHPAAVSRPDDHGAHRLTKSKRAHNNRTRRRARRRAVTLLWSSWKISWAGAMQDFSTSLVLTWVAVKEL